MTTLCFDANLLADYLDGHAPAEAFLREHESAVWAIPSLALFEAYMGALIGRPRGVIGDVHDATRGLEVLPITDETALAAARLQASLRESGTQLPHVDAVLGATAKAHGAAFATNDRAFWRDPVRDHVDVVEYHR